MLSKLRDLVSDINIQLLVLTLIISVFFLFTFFGFFDVLEEKKEKAQLMKLEFINQHIHYLQYNADEEFKYIDLDDLISQAIKADLLKENPLKLFEGELVFSLNEMNELLVRDSNSNSIGLVKKYCHGEYSSAAGCNEAKTEINITNKGEYALTLPSEYIKHEPKNYSYSSYEEEDDDDDLTFSLILFFISIGLVIHALSRP